MTFRSKITGTVGSAVILAALLIAVLPRVMKSTGFQNIQKAVYYCPMHPFYTSGQPGDCPICNMKLISKTAVAAENGKPLYYRNPMGQPDISPVPKKDPMDMDYIPVYAEDLNADSSAVPGRSTVKISSGDQQLLGMRTGVVEKRPFSSTRFAR